METDLCRPDSTANSMAERSLPLPRSRRGCTWPDALSPRFAILNPGLWSQRTRRSRTRAHSKSVVKLPARSGRPWGGSIGASRPHRAPAEIDDAAVAPRPGSAGFGRRERSSTASIESNSPGSLGALWRSGPYQDRRSSGGRQRRREVEDPEDEGVQYQGDREGDPQLLQEAHRLQGQGAQGDGQDEPQGGHDDPRERDPPGNRLTQGVGLLLLDDPGQEEHGVIVAQRKEDHNQDQWNEVDHRLME